MNRMMIDLETLGLGDKAPVIEIGVSIFYCDGITTSRQYNITDVCGEVESGTWNWWAEQGGYKRPEGEDVKMVTALLELSNMWKDYKCEEIWANGISFDIPKLEYHFEREQMSHIARWSSKEVRDFRTIRDTIIKPEIKPVASHCAMQDSIDQAQLLIPYLAD